MPGLREALVAKGLTSTDIAWFDQIGWDPASIPPAAPKTLADYRRREDALNETVDGITFADRAETQASKLAAAIGARIADLTDPDDEEEEQ